MPTSKQFDDAVEHAGRVYLLEDDKTRDADKPNYESASYLAQIDDVRFLRDIYGGTKTMRARKEMYLPRHPQEDDDDYQRRLTRAVLFNATKRTVGGLVGMMFRKDPVMDETMPGPIVADAENIDRAGRALPVFARDVAENAVIDGHTWLHVEFPRADPERIRVRGDEATLRPYWINVLKQDAINWRYELVDGRPVLTLFVYRETSVEADGDFGEVERDLYRVLRPGSFELWERVESDKKVRWAMVDQGATSLDFIPVVYVPANRTGIYESCPPLLDLAYENVGHYQVRSDHRYALGFASVPLPVFTGVDTQNIEWGAGRALFLKDPEAAAQILESSGASLDASREELKDIEARMAALGLQMLVRETRAAETASAKMLDKAEADSALSVVARAIEDALEEALRIHARYLGVEAGSVQVNRDFHEQTMDPQLVTALSTMVQNGQLSLDTLWAELVRGEVLHEDFDPDTEHERIAETAMDDLVRFTAAQAQAQAQPTEEAA